jgi:hypothetical protein
MSVAPGVSRGLDDKNEIRAPLGAKCQDVGGPAI